MLINRIIILINQFIYLYKIIPKVVIFLLGAINFKINIFLSKIVV